MGMYNTFTANKIKKGLNKMKKSIGLIMSFTLALSMLAGCGSSASSASVAAGQSSEKASSAATSAAEQVASADTAAGSFDTANEITVVTREEGSGTRGAFVELTGVEEKDADGNKTDKTYEEAVTVSSTSVVMTTVAGDPYAIGYISMGSLNDTVKTLDIDGIAATAENIKNGTYPISRPFNLAVKETVSETAQDFIDYIQSAEGQAVVEENGYISSVESPKSYAGTKPAGKVVVSGSSSVTPVMEKLKEAYAVINPNAEIEVQMSDSSTGMTSAIDGICDIGMSSRELKDSELEAGLTPIVMAMDGIAVIINSENPATAMSMDSLKSVFIGETLTWAEVK